MIRRGDVVWVDLGARADSEPWKVPVVVMQAEWLLDTSITTVLVAPITSNLALGGLPGNVSVSAAASGLDCDAVVDVSRFGPVSRTQIAGYPIGALPTYLLTQISAGLRLVSGF